MSTYIYLECLNHNPPLQSDGEVGQHLYDLPNIRNIIAAREAVNTLRDCDVWPDYGYFVNNAVTFLCAHPECRIGIRDEYGNEHDWEGR